MTEGRGISRRGLLQNAVCAAGAAAVIASTITTANAAKMPQTAVSYQGSPHGNQSCATCKLFIKPGSCKSVDGAVSPQGWCLIYQKA